MLSKIYHFFLKKANKLREREAIRNIRANTTFMGEGQNCFAGASVTLIGGATKKNVILESHSELYGNIVCYKNGRVIMHEWSKIGPGTVINCVNRVEIGKDTAIATNVLIIDNNTHPINPDDRRYMRHTPHGSDERQPWHSANAPIIIGENVWIGSNVRICKGITIGDNSIIAANSVLTKSVPANSVAAGNPARIVKEGIDKLTTPIFPLHNQ